MAAYIPVHHSTIQNPNMFWSLVCLVETIQSYEPFYHKLLKLSLAVLWDELDDYERLWVEIISSKVKKNWSANR